MSPQVMNRSAPPRIAAFNGRGGGGRARVSPPLLATGMVVVVLCTLAIASLYSGAARRDLVLALARPVPLGTPIADADLRDVEVAAGPGVATISASKRPAVVGRRPAVALVPGALLAPAQLRATPAPDPGQALVALALRPGQFPPEIAPGDPVRVVSTGSAAPAWASGTAMVNGGGGTGGTGGTWASLAGAQLAQATVVSLRGVPEAPGTTVVSLRLPEDAVPRVLQAGAAVALVIAGAGS